MAGGRFYATEELSPNIAKTPEGFLLCLEVPVARTGLQIYAPGEVPPDIEPSPNGSVTIERDPDEVFRPETLASYNLAPFTNEHPKENNEGVDVNPQNWKKFAVGAIFDARQGEGLADDLTFVDIKVYDEKTIDDILKGKRQISVGYDAEYEVLGVGHARQSNIVVNHVALVDNGRCGPRCAIRDEVPFLMPVRRRIINRRRIHIYF